MEEEGEILCVVPRGLVVGEVNEMFVCGICDGLLREPRYAGSCSEHLFCRVCLTAALIKEACCPTCKQPVDASEPLHRFGPFEAIVNSTVVRCPNSSAGRGRVDGNISQEPATFREASGSSARSQDSAQAPGVKEEAGDGSSRAGPRDGGAGGPETSSSPFDGVHVAHTELVALCKMSGIARGNRDKNKDQLREMLAPLYRTPKEVAAALQETMGAERPRSYGGKWRGFTGDYEELELTQLQEEARCEGLPLDSHDPRHRDAFRAADEACPTKHLDLAVSSSAKDSDKVRPTEGGKAFRAETLAGSVGSGGVGAGGSALSLGGKIASSASVVWDRRKLETMSLKDLIDVARGRGLTYSKMGTELHKSELEEYILEAQTFAASLRAKHPSSFERGASARGDWWGFPGDYEVLDSGDLETEASFCGVRTTRSNKHAEFQNREPEQLRESLRKRRANYAPDLDDVVASTRPSNPSKAGGAALTLGGKIASTAAVVWDRRELQQMTWKGVTDVARERGLRFTNQKHDLSKSDLEKLIVNAQSFAASLRAKHPSSCERGASARGDWWGFLGEYEVLDSGDLETEASFSAVRTTFHSKSVTRPGDPPTLTRLRPASSSRTDRTEKSKPDALCKALRKRRGIYAPDLDDVLVPTRPSKAGGTGLTLGGVWDREKLQEMSKQCLIDVARERGLSYSQQGQELHKPSLEEHIFKAQTFAATLRAKHPSSSELGASTRARGDWWGFPGDYAVLDPGDLETEASFCGVRTTYRKRRANHAPGLDDALASTRPSKRHCRAFDAQETCGWTGKLGALAEHLAECRFAVTKCTLAGCSAKVPRKDVGAHEAECVWRGGECERCLFEFTRGEPREHECGGQQTLRRQAIPRVTLLKGTVKVLKESLGSLHQEVQELRAALASKVPNVPASALSAPAPSGLPGR